MLMTKLLRPFSALKNPIFARLYIAQTANLFGDALRDAFDPRSERI
jgi:ABC-type dipeptide/oligopeptide/nickel transport system permease subunit